jgi:uncharacterized protein (TIGR03545 family)
MAKIPRFYKKTIAQKKFEARYVKKLQQKEDQECLRNCYASAAEQDENLHLRADLGPDDAKKLKNFKKAIKKNRKAAVRWLPFSIFGLVVAALVVFFAFFANPLLEKALETGMEQVFEAKVDINGFHFNPFKMEIAMGGMTVADRDKPMTNLFQLGSTEIKLKPAALLRGKVYIEELKADSLKLGTARTTSGALAAFAKTASTPAASPAASSAVTSMKIPPLVDLKKFDAEALVKDQLDQLQSFKLYEDAQTQIEASVQKWQDQADGIKKTVGDLTNEVKPLMSLNINDYTTMNPDTISHINDLVQQITTLLGTVKTAQTQVQGVVEGVKGDYSTATQLVKTANGAVKADYQHLASYINLSNGSAMDTLKPIVFNLLSPQAQTWLGYGERGLEALQKVKELKARLPASSETKEQKFKGRVVTYPVKAYPAFYLGDAATDVAMDGWSWAFDLKAVSSNPDLSAAPTTLTLGLTQAGDGVKRSASFQGSADLRTNAKQLFDAKLNGSGFPLKLSQGFSSIGVKDFSGSALFNAELAGQNGGDFKLDGNLSIVGAKLEEPSNTIMQAVSQALAQTHAKASAPSLDLGLSYTHKTGAADDFSMDSNIAALITAALKNLASAYTKQAEAALQKALDKALGPYTQKVNLSQENLEDMVKLLQGDQATVNSMQAKLEAQEKQFQDKLKNAAEDTAKKAAKQAAGNALKNLFGR